MAKSKKRSGAKKRATKGSKTARQIKTALRVARRARPKKFRVREQAARFRRAEKRPVKTVTVPERDPQAVKLYESALRSFMHQDFVRARDVFQKITEQFPKETEIVERSHVHLNICKQRLARSNAAPKTAEDYYLLAIAHLNRREFEPAESAFQKALALLPKGDHIFYGLAALESLRNNPQQALKHLQRAIQLNPNNRLTATRDSDFEPLVALPEFQALIRGGQPGA